MQKWPFILSERPGSCFSSLASVIWLSRTACGTTTAACWCATAGLVAALK